VCSLSLCYGLLTALVLLNSVARWRNTTQFFTKMMSFCLHVCMGFGRNFSRGGPLVDFPKVFLRGAKVVKFVFCHSKLRKRHFCWNFQIPAPVRTPTCLCVGKFCATSLTNLGTLKRFNTIPNNEILLSLIRKMKYLTDQFQLCFCFCIGNTK